MTRTDHHHRRRTRGPAPARRDRRASSRIPLDAAALAARYDDPAEREIARVRGELARRGADPCDDGRCPGWAIFNAPAAPEIQACDTCTGALELGDDDVARLPEAREALAAATRAAIASGEIDPIARWHVAQRIGATADEWRALAAILRGMAADPPFPFDRESLEDGAAACDLWALEAARPIEPGARVVTRPGSGVLAFGAVTGPEGGPGGLAGHVPTWFDGRGRPVRFPLAALARVVTPA